MDPGHHEHPDNHNGNDARHDNWENVLPSILLMHPAVNAFLEANASFIVTDPRLPGNPIIFASPGFLRLTGYSIDRVMGRNCRFLQGPGTDPAVVGQIREALDNGSDIAVTLLNYRRDGSTFWNHVLISGVRKEFEGGTTLLYYIGLQQPTRHPNDGTYRGAGGEQGAGT